MLSTLSNHWSRFCTGMLLKFKGIEHGRFITAGIPFFRISKIKGGSIRLGHNLHLNNGMSANQIGYGRTPCSFVAIGGRIIVGENVGMSQATLYALDADITIGDNTLLGGGTKIYTSDFHPVQFEYRRDRKLNEQFKLSGNVIVGADCFIGAGTTILKGVCIGERTVIGAGSIVTRSIPSDCIAAGNPCRVIKYLKDNK